jgi:hypothetical protein
VIARIGLLASASVTGAWSERSGLIETMRNRPTYNSVMVFRYTHLLTFGARTAELSLLIADE